MPLQASSYTPPLLANLEAGLLSLAEAVEAGEVGVDDQGVHLQALEAEEVPPDLESTKQALFQEVGRVQLPALLIPIDYETRFSWRLLGHAPTTDTELRTVYAALLAQGTELDAAGVALMMPALSEATIAEAMRRLENEAVWRDANALVLEFLHRHAVVKAWGEGTFASAEAMSLEASRHLWNARVDPRRRTYAIGTHSPVLGDKMVASAIDGLDEVLPPAIVADGPPYSFDRTVQGIVADELLGPDVLTQLLLGHHAVALC